MERSAVLGLAGRGAEARPLLVRQLSKTMELRIDGEDTPLMELPLQPPTEKPVAPVEQLLTLPSRNVRLRTRA